MPRQAGFTLVELVVVIIILGVLAATAMPKFIDVNSQAHEASVIGTGGAFGTAVALVRAQWIANGHSGAVDNLAGFGNADVDTSANGWPVATDDGNATPDASDCAALWNALLQGPPSIATSGTATDYTATADGSGGCTYTYNGFGGMGITYDSNNGAVDVDSNS